jgi:gamma-glutamyl phosphate reductase
MSLWTPDGEVPVDRSRQAAAGGGGVDDEAVASAAEALGIDPATLSPEDRERLVAMVAQMAEAQRRLAAADAADVVANHAMGLYEFAAIKLGSEPPQLDDARTAIDALGAVLDATGDRLGGHGPSLNEALDQIRLVWVRMQEAEAHDLPQG